MSIKNTIKNFLKNHPKIYSLIVRTYRLKDYSIYYLKKPNLINKRTKYLDELNLIDHFRNTKKANYFFGYYDKSPWDHSQKYLLYLSTPLIQRHPTIKDYGNIGVINLKTNEKQTVAKTRAWNWQMGCMLKWMKNKNNDPLFIHNDYRSGKYVSVIRNVEEGIQDVIRFPVYTIDYKSKKALSLNFQRLQHLRPGYGYHPQNYSLEKYSPSDDGIYSIDLEKREVELVLSLDELAQDVGVEKNYHWVNHIEFNPSGTRVVFFHRYKLDGKRESRLFTMNPDGSDLYCLLDGGGASHFTWKNDEEILAWARLPQSDNNKHYYLFKDKTKKRKKIGENILCQSGHPSFSSDKRWLLTDTYPDNGGWKTLILFDMKEKERYDLGKFYTPKKYNKYYGGVKSDLHPRWNRDGSKICFDSVHEGKRKMYVMDIDSLIRNINNYEI